MTKKVLALFIFLTIMVGCDKQTEYNIEVDDTYNRLSKIITLKPLAMTDKSSEKLHKQGFTQYETKHPPKSIYKVIDTSHLKTMRNIYLFNKDGELCSTSIAFLYHDAFLKMSQNLRTLSDTAPLSETKDMLSINIPLAEKKDSNAMIMLFYSEKEDGSLMLINSVNEKCNASK